MKYKYKFGILFLCLLFISGQAWSQSSSANYSIPSGTTVGGGGSSSSTNYSVGGAFPSTLSGSSSSANYSVYGGAPYGIPLSTLSAGYAGPHTDNVLIENQVLEVTYSSSGTVTGTFYYRFGGAATYQSASMSNPSAGTLAYTVGTNLLTVRGLEYYFSVTDGSNSINIGSAIDPYRFTVIMQTNAQGLSPAALPNAQYRIISLPIWPESNTNNAVFSDDFGVIDSKQWRLGRYFPSVDSVRIYPNAGNAAPGVAYWAIARGGKRYGTPGESVLPNDEYAGQAYFRVYLNEGWNMVGNPYGFTVDWADVIFDSAGTILAHINPNIEATAYSYSGTQYTAASTIPAWGGVFINSSFEGIVAMIPYSVTGLPKAATEEGFAGWKVGLSVETPAGLIDTDNFAGAYVEAIDGRDRFDSYEPPPPPGGPRLAFKNNGKAHRVDIRSDISDGNVWKIDLANCPSGTKLKFTDLDQIPVGMEAWLKTRGNLMKVSEAMELTLDGSEKSMELMIGSVAYLTGENPSGLPDQFDLGQNYPNPFNPTTSIEFSIPNAGQATLEIFNILGQSVITLIDNELPAGKYTVEWNSVDKNGSDVGSGVYFYKLTYGDFTEHRKMVLMK